ncbi:MAG: AbrB/MazE/SpoVT family DNA-binding domain-containing protein [Clostridia bacterium]|nr:AbrB/MazE/SpoVT family DNA-binding domain-containing protein [Clostridia bacterium]
MSDAYTIDVKVDPKGRITIPKDIRAALGAAKGGRVTFVVENDEIRVVNAALHALNRLQARLNGAAERAGLPDEQAASDRVAAFRKEGAR